MTDAPPPTESSKPERHKDAAPLLQRIREENLSIYRTSVQRLQEDVGQEDEIARDYRGRFLYELVQNSDDAMDPGSDARLRIELKADGIWFANTGRPLAEADVRGICGISASTKAAGGQRKRASIGHKGMGFKSSLEISRTTEVHSADYHFAFSEERSMHLLREGGFSVRHAPLMRLPWAVPAGDDWVRLSTEGFRTGFFFPFAHQRGAKLLVDLERMLWALPTSTFLFLKRLQGVEIRLPGRRRDWTARRHRVVAGERVKVSTMDEPGLYAVDVADSEGDGGEFLVAHDGDIAVGDHRGGLEGVSWEDVDITEVSVAVRLVGQLPVPVVAPRLHVFLPTGEPLPYSRLVNGAFSAGLSRQVVRVEVDSNVSTKPTPLCRTLRHRVKLPNGDLHHAPSCRPLGRNRVCPSRLRAVDGTVRATKSD